MRSIHANLTAGQKEYAVIPVVSVTFDGTDRSDYLVAYDYRERANQVSLTDVWLDNTSGFFNTTPPAIGDEVVISRGLTIAGTDYDDDLPTVFVEALEYHF